MLLNPVIYYCVVLLHVFCLLTTTYISNFILNVQYFPYNSIPLMVHFFKFELWSKKTNFKIRCRLSSIYATVFQMLFV